MHTHQQQQQKLKEQQADVLDCNWLENLKPEEVKQDQSLNVKNEV